MGMPNNLVLIRHGESEGNIAVARSKAQDHSAYDGPFADRHNSHWRLTEKGIQQAIETGKWLKKNLPLTFNRFYVSEYIRAMETAAHLNIENASWFPEFFLRERSWGSLDRISMKERGERFPETEKERAIDPLYWNPPNGEEQAQTCLRIDRVAQTLHRECEGQNVVIVCHGEVMWGFRLRLERMPQETFHELDKSKNPFDRIHNCQIIHYTRIHPYRHGESPAPYLNWRRSICPWNEKLSDGKWHEIIRPRYTNKELLERVGRVPRLIE